MCYVQLLVDERLHPDVQLRRLLTCYLPHVFLVVVELDTFVLYHNNIRILAHLLLFLESLRIGSWIEAILLFLHAWWIDTLLVNIKVVGTGDTLMGLLITTHMMVVGGCYDWGGLMEANITTRHIFIHFIIFLSFLIIVQKVHNCCLLVVCVDWFRMLAQILFRFWRLRIDGWLAV